ncbi:VOC family protein [Shewanella sp. SR44-3]|uniref:VOC family protein n=1 Tax=unclassified Shewanella TaxID=196818 RepID=UPI0015FD35D4|nr:VOC family protein [Shewanella sp. SR44-3]MBB1271079.1 VOC family protein [Shewanella sp. SR44-3]
MSITFDHLNRSWNEFSQQILGFIDTLGLSQAQLDCDHVALRVNSLETALQLEQAFSKQGQIISKNIINGRPIVIIALDTPLMLGGYAIGCVELPYPSEKVYPNEGWEHVELVFNCQAKNCEELALALTGRFPTLKAILETPDTHTSSGDIKVKMSSPKGDKERLANPTIALKQGNICVKIHTHHIKAIIASEQ